MVKLDRITTGGGDRGETSLVDGSRVAKYSPRIHAQGEVDEANAALGLARLHADAAAAALLARAQNDLFDLGADLATPGDDPADGSLRITDAHLGWLEAETARISGALAPLDSFVLRGGSAAAAQLHFACTVVRRAERAVFALAASEPINGRAAVYLNRLSDLLFVMARDANDGGRGDVKWRPGAAAKS